MFLLEKGGLKDGSEEEIVELCLGLLGKMIDFSDAFHITLLGLAVTDFLEQVEKKSSIKNFFISPKKDGIPLSVPTQTIKPKKNLFEESQEITAPGNSNLKRKQAGDLNGGKKLKTELDNARADTNENVLNSEHREEIPEKANSSSALQTCPSGYDPEVWINLPPELRYEMLQSVSKPEGSVAGTVVDEHNTKNEKDPGEGSSGTKREEVGTSGAGTSGVGKRGSGTDELECPAGYDPLVFSQLPEDIQRELVASKPRPSPSPGFRTVTGAKTTPKTTSKLKNSASKSKPKETNSILKYFSRD